MSPHSILIVEDDMLAGEDLKIQLEALGYAVPSIEPSGDKAIAAVEKFQPDLVLMDIFLEGAMDGIDAALEISRKFETPIVYMSYYSGEDALLRAKETQPFGYILKPYTQRELHAVLSMALDKAESERKLRESAWLSATLMNMQDALVSTDSEGKISSMNRAAEILLKTESRDAAGKPLTSFMAVEDREQHDTLTNALKEVFKNNTIGMRERNLFLVNADGSRIPISLTVSPIRGVSRILGAAVLIQPDEQPEVGKLAVASNDQLVDINDAGAIRNELTTFVHVVAHDLRAPLRAMQGFADALIEEYGAQLEGPGKMYARRIVNASRRMDQLIQGIVSYSRMATGPSRLQPVKLEPLIKGVVDDLSAELEEKHARIDLQAPMPLVMAHPATLARVMRELIQNASIFVQPGTCPEIRISTEEKSQMIRLYVEDRGIGIPPELTSKAFGIFQTLHTNDAYPGVGIGLAIVRRGVHWMGGDSGLEPLADGGLRAWFDLKAAD